MTERRCVRDAPYTLLQPWQQQQAIVGNVFGWQRSGGTRRYREAFVFVPRKCGKTEMAGGRGNLLTFADGEAAGQLHMIATCSHRI